LDWLRRTLAFVFMLVAVFNLGYSYGNPSGHGLAVCQWLERGLLLGFLVVLAIKHRAVIADRLTRHRREETR
jgi:hypothetical protein